ncbi:uncharacterized protein LOC141589766 [Silene latifolia]|uniref:uncharacterized protein LOC141589766 n=1 Tax=Silene latifolia TaxID=37657 RepID=UPI003D78AA06
MWKTSLLRVISGRIKGSGGGNLGILIKRGYSASQGSGDTQGYVPIPTNRTADPAIHSSDQADVNNGSNPHKTIQTESEPFTPPKSPTASSPKLEHTEVGLPSKPNTHQKRQSSSQSAQTQTPPEPVTEIICSGPVLDPWPDNEENLKAQNKAQDDDNKEYFKDHKASPLSEIEFADTRKPITQATDTNTREGVIVFKEEQQDTAEEALLRAAEIWKWNKMRGDPDSPHGRVLRQLCGESW